MGPSLHFPAWLLPGWDRGASQPLPTQNPKAQDESHPPPSIPLSCEFPFSLQLAWPLDQN